MKKRIIHISLLGVLVGVATAVPFFLWFHTSTAEYTTAWGVTYSASQAEYLDLDPKELYDAIITDLRAKRIKIHINWNATEPVAGEFDFALLDYQIAQAEQHDVKLILVIGMKTGRWPECHTPLWLHDVPQEEREAEVLEYVQTIVDRYRHNDAVEYWQIENEPFLEFGECPQWYYDLGTSLVEKEITLVRTLDSDRKVIVSESGELADWTKAAALADIVGVTMYRSTWNDTVETFGVNPYSFLRPEFYATKAGYISAMYKKPVMSIELQAEPWTAKPLKESKLEIQAQSMNVELFKENIEFARQAKLDGYYFWGTEWWYWMKTKHNQPEIWDQAKIVFEG